MITGIVAVLGYPVAYAMVPHAEGVAILLMILSCLATPGTGVCLEDHPGGNGVINNQCRSLVQEPLWLIYSKFAVIVTLTSVFLPITVLPLYSSLMNIPYSLIEASRDLGADSAQTFRKVTLPLSMPGVVAGFIFTFVLTAGDYVTPAMPAEAMGR
jgi:spermidine/putrescine transport system permease protein